MGKDPLVKAKKQPEQKQYKKAVRKDPKVRSQQQTQQKEYKQTLRQNPEVQQKEKDKQKEYNEVRQLMQTQIEHVINSLKKIAKKLLPIPL